MDIQTGLIVTSIAGRDKNKNFAVVSIIDEMYVYIADGKYHRLEAPKKKKIKHIKTTGDTISGISAMTNRLLREALRVDCTN